MSRPAELRDAALAVLARGWAPVALHHITDELRCSCGDLQCSGSAGKHPLGSRWQKGQAPTREQVEATWRAHPLANVGIRTGAVSGLVVLDFDRKGARADLEAITGPLPATYEVTTGSGGSHLYFRAPQGVKVGQARGSLPSGMDVRGEGGQVVAPPSTSLKGPYVLAADLEVAELPAGVLELIQRPRVAPLPAPAPAQPLAQCPPRPAGAGGHQWQAYTDRAVGGELARLDQLPRPWTEGAEWRLTTYSVACNLLDLADSPWCPLDAAEVDRLVAERAPGDGKWGHHQVAAELRSARDRASAGRGRPEPQRPTDELSWLAALADQEALTGAPPAAAATEAPGTTEADREQQDAPVGRPHLKDRLLSLKGLAALPAVEPLVDGLLYRDTLAQLSGPPGSYKSFLALGMALSVAAGLPFEGHRVPRAGRVLYVAPEGWSGLRARALAWCYLTNVDPQELEGQFMVVREPLNLASPREVTEAMEVAQAETLALVVFDTRARSTLGLEENSASEQGRAIAAAEAIQSAPHAGSTVLVVHHSGRSGEHGRGSTAWDGAIASDLRVTGSDLRATIKVAKLKDAPDGEEHPYELKKVTVPQDWMPGVPEIGRSSLVAVQSSPWTPPLADGKNERIVQKIIWTLAPPQGLPPGELRDLAVGVGASRSGAYGAINALVTSRFLRNVGTEKRPSYVTDQRQPYEGGRS